MAGYATVVGADSPLFSYYPDPGYDITQNWVTAYRPTVEPLMYYNTSAPYAVVQFDFYGETLNLIAPGEPGCGYTILLNGEAQNQSFHSTFNLPLAQYHLELDVNCGDGGSMAFEGVILNGWGGTGELLDTTVYVTPDKVTMSGEWEEMVVYSEALLMNVTQYQTYTAGSSLQYSFKGVQTQIIGAVDTDGGTYSVDIDEQITKTFSPYRPIYDDTVILWFEQFLDNDETHTVTITNLAGKLLVEEMNYDVLIPLSEESK